jgi:hypothetical protein
MPRKKNREQRKAEENRPVTEAGGGEAEGFEQSEKELRRQAENLEEGHNPKYDKGRPEPSAPGVFAEADEERTSERPDDER